MNSPRFLIITALAGLFAVLSGLWLVRSASHRSSLQKFTTENSPISSKRVSFPVQTAPDSEATTRSNLPTADQTKERIVQMLALVQGQMARPDVKPDEALLRFKSPSALEAFLQRAAQEGLEIKGTLPGLGAVRVGFKDLAQLDRSLAGLEDELFDASANYVVRPPPGPSLGSGEKPYGDSLMTRIGAGAEVDRTTWGEGVLVAVLDSGVTDHPAFRPGQVTHIDLVKDGKTFDAHGTAMASLVAGSLPGAKGVAPAAKILDVRILDGAGSGDSFLLAQGIETAVSQGAQVINISLGSYGDAPVVAEAIRTAQSRGVHVVASTGNDQTDAMAWPAAYAQVISVSAVDAAGSLATFSNGGSPTLGAPGVGIPSAYTQDGQSYLAQGSGTSQAAALVSGAAAAIKSWGGNVPLTLTSNAVKNGTSTPNQTGAGVLKLPSRR